MHKYRNTYTKYVLIDHLTLTNDKQQMQNASFDFTTRLN